MTIDGCKQVCERFLVGSRVMVRKEERSDHRIKRVTKTPAKVTGKYPDVMTVQFKSGLRESYRYTDIVRKKMLELI